MAKCVACKAINAAREHLKHPNSITKATADELEKRWRQTDPYTNPKRFCAHHLEVTMKYSDSKEESSNAASI